MRARKVWPHQCLAVFRRRDAELRELAMSGSVLTKMLRPGTYPIFIWRSDVGLGPYSPKRVCVPFVAPPNTTTPHILAIEDEALVAACGRRRCSPRHRLRRGRTIVCSRWMRRACEPRVGPLALAIRNSTVRPALTFVGVDHIGEGREPRLLRSVLTELPMACHFWLIRQFLFGR
jgi:hypothetical protein